MSKTIGARSRDYEEKRDSLLRRIADFVLSAPNQGVSMRQIAQGCGVSMPTLTHYFHDRNAMFEAVLELAWRDAADHLAAAALPEGNLAFCVEAKLRSLADGFVGYQVDKLNAWGLAQGLGQDTLGPAYLTFFLEPTLQAAEAWLSHYQAVGEIRTPLNLRYAAVSLYSPLVLMFMHQRSLGGDTIRHADMDDFIRCHAESFVRSIAP
jgi:AcrR family transcriptional regulator